MNKMIVLAAALGSALLFGGTAQAAPIGNVTGAAESAGSPVSQIDYRGYRHCHWRYGRRWCHGGHGYRGYGGPGINLYIGPRYRGYRGHRGYRGNHWRGHRRFGH